MLKALIKKQLAEILYSSFLRNRKKRSGKGMLVALILVVAYLILFFGGMNLLLSGALIAVGKGWFYYLLLTVVSVLFGTFGSVFTTYSTLYLAKDNDLLLSSPIPVGHIILSRLFSVYIMGLGYSGLISLPGVIVSWIHSGFRFSHIVGGLVLVLLVSLVVLGLSCLLGWAVARLSLRMKNKSWMALLLSLAFLGLYFYFYFRFMKNLDGIIDKAEALAVDIESSSRLLWRFGRIGEGDWLAMLCAAAATALFLGLIWLLMKKSFLTIATSSAAVKKAVYRERQAVQGSASSALLRKEWYRFSSSSSYMLNCGLGLVFELLIGGYLLLKGGELLSKLDAFLSGFNGLGPVLLTVVCCAAASMVDISAPSVSLEGKSIWLIQSLPVDPWQILRAKLQFHLTVSFLPTLFCAVAAMLVCPGTLAQKLLLLAVTLLFMLLFALLGLCLGVKMPNLSWTNENVPIKQSGAVAITIFSAMGLTLAIGGLYFLFGWIIGATAYLSLFALLFLAADAALFLWLRGPGSRRFAELTV